MTSPWRKSSRSGTQSANCVEARTSADRFELRDSKLGDTSPILAVGRTTFAAFLTDVKRGGLDG